MSGSRGPTAPVAAATYSVAAVVLTWPLVAGIWTDIPWDLGDSVLNAWALQWGADRLLAALAGDFGSLARYFHPGIFHPEPFALAYSEHLTPLVLQVLPVYAVTGNIVFGYNLLFLSTFVLSGLGMFLLAREWTGNARAAWVAGLIFAFLPYRVAQFSHLQVLSSQWMPFALYGLARYFRTGGSRSLIVAAVSLVANNLSCGYYLLYFAPFAALYAVWEVARRQLWRRPRVWLPVAGTGLAVLVATAPFLWPYAASRARGFEPRPLQEVVSYSADVYSYLTTHELNRVWGGVARAFPRSEGELFPGAVPLLLATLGLAGGLRAAWRRDGEASAFAPGGTPPRLGVSPTAAADRGPDRGARAFTPDGIAQDGGVGVATSTGTWIRRALGWTAGAVANGTWIRRAFGWTAGAVATGTWIRRALGWTAGGVGLVNLGLLVAIVATGRVSVRFAGVPLRASSPGRTLIVAVLCGAVVAACWPRLRVAIGRGWRSPLLFAAGALALAWSLSLGPRPSVFGRPFADWGPYAWLYDAVPGFDGLRVPARFAMVASLFGAALAAYGARVLDGLGRGSGRGLGHGPGRSLGRGRLWPAAGLGLLVLVESAAVPLVVNGMSPVPGYVTPEGPLRTGGRVEAVYRAVATLPESAVVVEFPFGVEDFELRYMLASAEHRRPLLNGYSGGYPLSYIRHRAAFARIEEDPAVAWEVLAASGATHAVVHEASYLDGRGAAVSAWLESRGASLVGSFGPDRLFRLPAAGR